ncbi:MAG: iron-siderophore ABC transporter substrate-binding protein [Corynebacterium sp.]|uniref:iron-siderophore ABC transporter substrate-binding protein n=1 Tax=Corynebacterium sp. TaxID=1720 RepID=UPI0026DAFE1E|nr:iron-siderophore ABC transporter substrate-binding protein [Corynebacterium sp.]MDO4761979.1 iron-siderophore ABC transporter substrate-binding protein [Corynebacterium sp.]
MNLRRSAVYCAILSVALGVAACSSVPENSTTGQETSTVMQKADSTFEPVTITHAFGETTLEKKPVRVATVGWGNHEVPLALGIVPVGMAKVTWGDDDDNGMLPWVEEALKQLGGSQPVLFDETDSLAFEDIAATKPDVILASYSGITQEDYDKLSKIAPTIAYPSEPWTTSMEEMITMNATALGMQHDGGVLIDVLEEKIAEEFAARPALHGKKALFTSFGSQEDFSTIGFYQLNDPRVGILKTMGLGVPRIVEEKSRDDDAFYVEVSAEQPELFDDVDFLISFGSEDPKENEETLKKLQADPLLGTIKAIAAGRVAFIADGPLSAVANPAPLAIEWGLSDYLDVLEEAAKK